MILILLSLKNIKEKNWDHCKSKLKTLRNSWRDHLDHHHSHKVSVKYPMIDNQINLCNMVRNKVRRKTKLLLRVKNKLVNCRMRRLIIAVVILLTCLLGIVSLRRLPHRLLARRARDICQKRVKEKKKKIKNN